MHTHAHTHTGRLAAAAMRTARAGAPAVKIHLSLQVPCSSQPSPCIQTAQIPVPQRTDSCFTITETAAKIPAPTPNLSWHVNAQSVLTHACMPRILCWQVHARPHPSSPQHPGHEHGQKGTSADKKALGTSADEKAPTMEAGLTMALRLLRCRANRREPELASEWDGCSEWNHKAGLRMERLLRMEPQSWPQNGTAASEWNHKAGLRMERLPQNGAIELASEWNGCLRMEP